MNNDSLRSGSYYYLKSHLNHLEASSIPKTSTILLDGDEDLDDSDNRLMTSVRIMRLVMRKSKRYVRSRYREEVWKRRAPGKIGSMILKVLDKTIFFCGIVQYRKGLCHWADSWKCYFWIITGANYDKVCWFEAANNCPKILQNFKWFCYERVISGSGKRRQKNNFFLQYEKGGSGSTRNNDFKFIVFQAKTICLMRPYQTRNVFIISNV